MGTEILREKCVLSIQHHVMMKERIARNKTGVGDVLKSWLEILTLFVLLVYIKIFCGDLEACKYCSLFNAFVANNQKIVNLTKTYPLNMNMIKPWKLSCAAAFL